MVVPKICEKGNTYYHAADAAGVFWRRAENRAGPFWTTITFGVFLGLKGHCCAAPQKNHLFDYYSFFKLSLHSATADGF